MRSNARPQVGAHARERLVGSVGDQGAVQRVELTHQVEQRFARHASPSIPT